MFVKHTILILCLVSCSVAGPVLQPGDETAPFDLPGVGRGLGIATWSFQPANGGWKDLRVGELVFMRQSALRPKARFLLRLVARNRNASLRLKQYSGIVTRSDNILNLFTERCTVHGKKDFIDRAVPLEGWTCDHLLFRLRVQEDGTLVREKGTAQWLYIERFQPLASYPAGPGQLVWAGQRLAGNREDELPVHAPSARYGDQTYPGGILTADDGAVYFGYDAGRHLRPGQNLLLFTDRGTEQGRILHVIDDFVLVQKASSKAPVAGTRTTRARAGLFD